MMIKILFILFTNFSSVKNLKMTNDYFLNSKITNEYNLIFVDKNDNLHDQIYFNKKFA